MFKTFEEIAKNKPSICRVKVFTEYTYVYINKERKYTNIAFDLSFHLHFNTKGRDLIRQTISDVISELSEYKLKHSHICGGDTYNNFYVLHKDVEESIMKFKPIFEDKTNFKNYVSYYN